MTSTNDSVDYLEHFTLEQLTLDDIPRHVIDTWTESAEKNVGDAVTISTDNTLKSFAYHGIIITNSNEMNHLANFNHPLCMIFAEFITVQHKSMLKKVI